MESSEEDAGAATNASRRASARERDVGGGEDGGTSDDMPLEPSRVGATSETASMSEEGFDADSVPSPSAQDVNTSTEALLDMIDEIVDGPDATRRRSHSSPDAYTDIISTAAALPTEPPTPCPMSLQTSSLPTLTSAACISIETISHESVSDPPSKSELHLVAPTSYISVEKLSESVNKTLEESPPATPTGVIPPTEVLQGKSEDFMQGETIKNVILPVEMNTRPVMQENIQNEQPCEEGELPSDSTINQPNESVTEHCPEVSTPTDSMESVPKVSKYEEQVMAICPSKVHSDNLSTIETTFDALNVILPQNLSKPIIHSDSPQASSSIGRNEAAESRSRKATALISSIEPSIPSSSVAEVVQDILDSSENQISERTIKCVSSSDNRENVTVGSAESTSSESVGSRVSEERPATSEPAMRSPLRRRLVRPAPSDRRPDSTVSSSVDLLSVQVDTIEQTTSESVTKDVSSSSDAVTSVYCNIKPEEIRISEISVCKAETSMNPPKKIKLVRNKSTPLVAQRELPVTHESEQCQSTSSECNPSKLQDSSSVSSVSQCAQPEDTTPSLRKLVVSDPELRENSNKKFSECEGNRENLCPPPASTERQVASKSDEDRRVPPIKLNLSTSSGTVIMDSKSENQEQEKAGASTGVQETAQSTKQVPKLTIKLSTSSKQSEESKSPIPKLTIKPIRPPLENDNSKKDMSEQVPSIVKLNIKPIPKPAEKVNDIHRKSSSSEISESESSENDESNSMSDPTSNSDTGSEVVPKVTIKVGKPGTESEGKFYTEKNEPKHLIIKGLQTNENEEHESKLKLVISPPDQEKQLEKIPKLTIKTVSKSEGQPLSPKLTIKPIRQPENKKMDSPIESIENPPIPKMKITTEAMSTNMDVKENAHIPKITIKPVIKTDAESLSKTPKKSAVLCESAEHIPVVTKLNIKPILKPTECEKVDNLEERVPIISKLHIKPVINPADVGETSEASESQTLVFSKSNIKTRSAKSAEANDLTETTECIPVVSKLNIKPVLRPTESGSSEELDDKVPVISKLNIKPILKPKDSEIECSLEDVPKITKLNIKPLKNPEEKSSEQKDCDVKNTEENSLPVVTKINIKPIVKPHEEDTSKDSENQSSETGNSSDDNADHIPVVTKINIKPILKPDDQEQDSTSSNMLKEGNIPVVTKLNIKPLVKPDESRSPSSPKKDIKITKLNIKPIVKPEEISEQNTRNDCEDVVAKNPPLLMKINIKNVTDTCTHDRVLADKKPNSIEDQGNKHMMNNVEESLPKVTKLNIKPILESDTEKKGFSEDSVIDPVNCNQSSSRSLQSEIPNQNCVSEDAILYGQKNKLMKEENNDTDKQIHSSSTDTTNVILSRGLVSNINENIKIENPSSQNATNQALSKPQSVLQNCTLLKKLLETKKDGLDKRLEEVRVNINHSQLSKPETTSLDVTGAHHSSPKINSEVKDVLRTNEVCISEIEPTKHSSEEINSKETTESLTRPLEINISEKITNQSSGQDSPRIILKINKTDHGPSAKLITEERPTTPQQNALTENTQEIASDKQIQKKVVNSRKKPLPDTPNVQMGKRLRSSRIVDEKSPTKKYAGKRPPSTETSPVQIKEPELSVLESKRLKLGQLLSNKSLTITAVPAKSASVSPTKPSVDTKRPIGKTVNHSLLNNENCSKNGNSKLHNILSNLQAKQAQALAFSEMNRSEKISVTPELESNTSTGSSDVVEVIENSHANVLIITDTSESRDLLEPADEASQDPLEVAKPVKEPSPSPVPTTPQPRKRGRPRKLPLSEPPKPVVLPVPALEERPQRSLRLSRDRPTPTILAKPRGRGRGRGAKRAEPEPRVEPVVETANKFYVDEKPVEDIDPTSSRIKLPRMTEALDKLPACTTPLSSRRRSSSMSASELKLFESEPKVVLSILPNLEEALTVVPETPGTRGGRGGRGKRGGRGGTPGRGPRASRGRGRGGGRGAQYMKETMGIYGRVCGPATTTLQLFEEETCMMDDNATPAKSMQDDEDSQSSILSSTNDSSRMKKSKFADLFDSNKVWTAADVKEYVWPPPETPDVEHQVMMIQEQVAMFLGVKSFKRRYPELKRRAVTAEERDYVLQKELVTEALCDLGITAVDASEVLDIMLSDYPHKYEEYRQHQRERQLAEATAVVDEPKEPEPKVDRVEMKVESKPVEAKPEPPKVDLEKTRQEALAAAIASASEWNAALNAVRRGACVDLQSHTVHRRRAPVAPRPPPRAPPAGLYPHALLPGQYQHHYNTYTSEQLRYFPLNTVVSAPPPPSAPPCESESEPEWGTSSSGEDSDSNRPSQAKRKKLSKTKRSSQQAEASGVKEEPKEEVDLCRTCKLRLEANRKHTHERFLVCATCNAKLHPGCVELSADTVRKAREYAWQCAECKACCSCGAPKDHNKMLFCDLCDRGFHIYCVGLPSVPTGRWHCVECAICKSCGARSPGGTGATGGAVGTGSAGGSVGTGSAGGEEAAWHHHTKRGPGGHKVYSHSLCTPCARAYRIGRYCPLCDRSFIGPKGTMQLVICKLCDRQHHQECVKQTVSALNVLDYTCAECRRGGITSRSAAARLAPRTIATLFMAKRRFNKYAHRQYMQSRAAPPPEPAPEPSAVAGDESDPLEGAGDALEGATESLEGAGDTLEGANESLDPPDETAAAVAALQMDFGD